MALERSTRFRVFLFLGLIVAPNVVLLGARVRSGPETHRIQEEVPAERTNLKKLVDDCRKCHEDVHDEWSATQHAKSWTDPVFQEAIKDAPDKGESCAPCHAPRALFHTGLGELPLPRKLDRDLGVNCVTCHVEGNIYHGPFESTGHGGVEANPDFRASKFCISCHGRPVERAEHDQGSSYLAGPEAKGGKSCQECHMDPVERKLVTKDTIKDKFLIGVQPCRKHNFKGARRSEIVAGSADLSIGVASDSIQVSVVPKTGHSLPATSHRDVRLVIRQLDAKGGTLDETLKTYAFPAGPVLNPGVPNLIPVPKKSGVVSVQVTLTQVLCAVPGRPEPIVQPIAELTKEL